MPVKNSNGTYTFYNLNSGLVLDDPAFSTTPGQQFDQWPANGGNNQQFNLNPVPSFTVSATPVVLTVAQGSATTSTISIADLNGFAGTVSLSVSGLPVGVSSELGLNSISGSQTSTLTLTASPTAAAGQFTVTVTATDGSLVSTTTLSLTVTSRTILSSIVVSPSAASLHLTSSQQFTAIAYDQYGNALSPQPSFTWTIVPGGVGSISTSGQYSSGGAPGTATVQATAT